MNIKLRQMRYSLFLLFGVWLVPAIVQAQQRQKPDCSFSFTFTAAAQRSTAYDNRAFDRPNDGCSKWTVEFYVEGFTAWSIQADSAPSVAAAPGSWTVWLSARVPPGTALPMTQAVATQEFTVYGYRPWVSVYLNSVTGSGTISGTAYGWKPWSGENAGQTGSSSVVVGPYASNTAVAIGSIYPTVIGVYDGTTIRPVLGSVSATGALLFAGVQSANAAALSPDAATTNISLPDVNSVGNLPLYTSGSLFNGASWDKAFYCPSTASIAALGATTTQVIAGTAAQRIRICSVMLSNTSATTTETVSLVEGTGVNCATGQTTLLQPMVIGNSTLNTANVVLGLGATGALTTTTAADSLCATGVGAGSVNVTVTYAKY